jgi:hypothetical protein
MLLSRVVKCLTIAAALFCASGARADVLSIVVTNATYQATCVGGVGTCTEVINGTITGSGTFQNPTLVSTNLSLTGTLNATLSGFGTPPLCNQGSCTIPPLFFDANALSGHSPIEWNPTLNVLPALTPTAIPTVGSGLTIPTGCGGDVANCGATGTFPTSSSFTYQLVSGTYVALDETDNVQGGSPSSPVILVQGIPVAQVTGSISSGQQDFYQFLWGGGAFSASTMITSGSGDVFSFSAGTVGTCNSIGSTTLNSGNAYSGTISSGNLAQGTYCIGLTETSGSDPNFAINFSTPLSTPEPGSFVLLAAGLGMIGIRRIRARAAR